MYLVTGITGNVGGAAARHLLEMGMEVRALVRDEAKAADWAAAGVDGEGCVGRFSGDDAGARWRGGSIPDDAAQPDAFA